MQRLLAFSLIFILSSFTCKKDSPAVSGAGEEPSTFNVDRSAMLQLINDIRQKGCNCGGTYMPPVAPVSWNDQLAQAAYNHSKDMNAKKYFSHTSPSGSEPGDRIRAAGYSWRAYGENIAFNYPDEQAVVAGWLKSVNHCKTIMNRNYKEMGVARAGSYWTQDFGAR